MVTPVKGTILSWRGACGADIDKHCSTLPAGPVILRCLSKHRATLAPNCLAKMKQAARDFAFACVNDTRKRSPGRGGRRGPQYWNVWPQKQRRLERGCRKVVGMTKSSVVAWRGACGADIDKFCRQTAPGWHAMGCLGKHHKQVSAPCQAQLQTAAQNFVAICAADLREVLHRCRAGQRPPADLPRAEPHSLAPRLHRGDSLTAPASGGPPANRLALDHPTASCQDRTGDASQMISPRAKARRPTAPLILAAVGHAEPWPAGLRASGPRAPRSLWERDDASSGNQPSRAAPRRLPGRIHKFPPSVPRTTPRTRGATSARYALP